MVERQGNTLSRRKFIVVAGGSVAATPFLAACGSASGEDVETAEFGDGDVGILNFALTFEHLQADFYAELAKSNFFGVAGRQALGKFGEEEDDHIASLTKEVTKLGGKPAAKPKTKFSLKTEDGTLKLAGELENVGAAAYLGQLPKIESDSVLKTVLSIHSVEGRHAAAINELLGEEPTPDGAFAEPATVESALATIKPFMA
jgi:rubrerythrin